MPTAFCQTTSSSRPGTRTSCFRGTPNHPSLNFKRVGRRHPVYSVRVSAGYRALGVMEQNDIIWFWIGSHQEYDRLLRRS